MFGSSWPMNCHTSMPLSLRTSFGATSAYFCGQPTLEEIGGLDDVVVDADQDEVFELHGIPPSGT